MDKIKVGSNIYESKLPVRTEQHYSKTTTRQLNKWLSGLDYKTVTQKYLDSFKG